MFFCLYIIIVFITLIMNSQDVKYYSTKQQKISPTKHNTIWCQHKPTIVKLLNYLPLTTKIKINNLLSTNWESTITSLITQFQNTQLWNILFMLSYIIQILIWTSSFIRVDLDCAPNNFFRVKKKDQFIIICDKKII